MKPIYLLLIGALTFIVGESTKPVYAVSVNQMQVIFLAIATACAIGLILYVLACVMARRVK